MTRLSLVFSRCRSEGIPFSRAVGIRRGYHSYPDPDDVPVITTAKSTIAKKLNKGEVEYKNMKKFDMQKDFQVPFGKEVPSFAQQPKTLLTKLSSGLTVASQDMPGLMSSVALLVKSGRYLEFIYFSMR
jgi:hypothetical protein